MVYGKTPFQHIQPKALKVAAITGGPEIAFADIDNKDLLDTIKVGLLYFFHDSFVAHDEGGNLLRLANSDRSWPGYNVRRECC